MTRKADLRERVWDDLDESGEARFPFPPHGRIPNFAGADAAADRLADEPEWARADAIKANPDAPQLPARRRALREGTTVYMAVPRLRHEKPFVELDPAQIDDTDAAATVSSMDEYGRQVAPAEMEPVDLILVGSVAVTPAGARIGKGEGYSDLEYALLSEFDLVGPDTPVATTVHDRQVVEDEVPIELHDVPLDLIATPTRVLQTDTPHARPEGVRWDLAGERLDEIPALRELYRRTE